ncbi:hypothetical protein AWENTII_008933 [Aspergillus wentii]
MMGFFLIALFLQRYISPTLVLFLFVYINLTSSECISERASPTCPVSLISLPSGTPSPIPQIQHQFTSETQSDRLERIKRQQAVRKAFQHSWTAYKDHAWLWDELSPISCGRQNPLGGWAATLVDSLDTLIVMGLVEEFETALQALNEIDFSTTKALSVNIFETTIRYLGGLISAYDLTNGKHSILLEKAQQLADFLLKAFATSNRMPQTRWEWIRAVFESSTESSERTLLAEIGSLGLEFTRLSQITGDAQYFDAVQRIADRLHSTQNRTRLPGLWPVSVDARTWSFSNFSNSHFTVGGMADSTYEYLVKEYLLLGAQSDQYRDMYIHAIEGIKQHLLFRGMDKGGQDVLFAGDIRFNSGSGEEVFEYQMEHLKCFLGGMVGLGARVFGRPADLTIARKLVDGCIWAYNLMPTGIMPETVYISGCRNSTRCEWREEKWHRDIFGWPEEREMPPNLQDAVQRVIQQHGLQPPILEVADPKYRLRPEAIESIFTIYRITGDKSLQDTAWQIFQNIERYTKSEHGYAAINDTRDIKTSKLDVMESFWLAETLKYFYLIFSDPNLISLDEYVL